MTGSEPIGFLGLGVMGRPMATNLVRTYPRLVVWNRTAAKAEPLRQLGASVADGPADVIRRCEVTLMMLSDEAAVDATLGRGAGEFAVGLAGRILVHMGTTSPEYSAALAADVRAAGGTYVEAPVSGSRGPAEAGQLIGMLAGEPDALARVRPVIERMCRRAFDCGPVPGGLLMKLAINTFLISLVCGLTEAFHLAEGFGLDTDRFARIVNSGPMSSAVAGRKLEKLLAGDFDVEAAVSDVHKNTRLIVGAARRRGIASPLLDLCEALYDETVHNGFGEQDMVAVRHAVAASRTPD